MGASSDEIDREIRETRNRLDAELVVLEQRAALGARRVGRVAAGVGVGLLAVAIAVIAYRRSRKGTRVQQLRNAFLESLRDLPDDVASRLKDRLPIKVVVTDKAHEESATGTWAGIARKVAPTVIGSATGAIASRVARGAPPRVPEPD
jgi:hypothetical protein